MTNMEKLKRNKELAHKTLVSKSHNVGKPPATTKASTKKKIALGELRTNRSPAPLRPGMDKEDYFRNKNKSVDLQALQYNKDGTLDPQRALPFSPKHQKPLNLDYSEKGGIKGISKSYMKNAL